MEVPSCYTVCMADALLAEELRRRVATGELSKQKSKISNTEWWLVIGALATADLTMILLDFTGIGEFIDPFIDSFIAMAFPFYLHMRGQDMKNNKRIASIVATWLIGLVSDGVFDFWFLDGLYNKYLAKAEDALIDAAAKIPMGQTAMRVAQMRQRGNQGVTVTYGKTVETTQNRNGRPMPPPTQYGRMVQNRQPVQSSQQAPGRQFGRQPAENGVGLRAKNRPEPSVESVVTTQPLQPENKPQTAQNAGENRNIPTTPKKSWMEESMERQNKMVEKIQKERHEFEERQRERRSLEAIQKIKDTYKKDSDNSST